VKLRKNFEKEIGCKRREGSGLMGSCDGLVWRHDTALICKCESVQSRLLVFSDRNPSLPQLQKNPFSHISLPIIDKVKSGFRGDQKKKEKNQLIYLAG
jgi:hypothetical protein